jgi:DNA-binding transcriptional regulator YbjK
MATAKASGARREQVVDAGLRLVAGGGLGAITHRSVESAAGVPHGTVTYWFGSRDGLVAAMVDRLVADSEARVAVIAGDVAATFAAGGAPDVAAIAAAVADWMQAHAERQVARLELELAAARDPRLRPRMRDAAQIFWRLCEPLVAAAGSPEPERDGRAMAAMIDGLLLDRLAHPPQDDAVLAAAVRQLLSSWA